MNNLEKLIKLIEIANDHNKKIRITIRVEDYSNNKIVCEIDNCISSGNSVDEAILGTLNKYHDVVRGNELYYRFYSKLFLFLENEGTDLIQ